MILGEGSVFLLLLLLGFRKIKKSIDKEITLSKNQNNFLLSITHELKTPIASIKLYLQTLNKGKISAKQNESLLNNAIKENKRLEDLINNILHVSSMDSNKMQPNKESIEYLKKLGQDERKILRDLGVKFGRYHIFLHQLIKPEAVSLRTLLWKNYNQKYF